MGLLLLVCPKIKIYEGGMKNNLMIKTLRDIALFKLRRSLANQA